MCSVSGAAAAVAGVGAVVQPDCTAPSSSKAKDPKVGSGFMGGISGQGED
jgi:hypothetical protein